MKALEALVYAWKHYSIGDLLGLGGSREFKSSEKEMLVDKLVYVAIQPTLRRKCRFVQISAFIVAFAGLYKHDAPLEAFAIRTDKEHGGRSRAARRAASPIQTHSAIIGSIETSTATAGIMQTQRLRRLLGTRALPPLLLHKHRLHIQLHLVHLTSTKHCFGGFHKTLVYF